MSFLGVTLVNKEDYQQHLANLCAETFGDNTAAAVLFMIRPHPELQNRTPGCTAVTESGAKAVEEIIQRGRHGLPV